MEKVVNPLPFIVGFFHNDQFKSEWLMYLCITDSDTYFGHL